MAQGGRSTPTVVAGRPVIVLVAVAAMAALCLRAGSHGLGALVLGACATTWLLCPPVAALAMRAGAFVRQGGRSTHDACVPRLGGLALYVPVAAALFWTRGPHWAALLGGCTIVLLAGAWDDVRGLTPRAKIGAQVLAALVLVLDGYRITGLRVDPLGTLPIGGFEAFAIVLWIIATTNAINIIDGVDGLAATVALVAALAHAALGAPLVLALALAGASLGFLRHNLPRARLFLGDSGSLLLGFLLGALPLAAPGPLNLPVALGLLALPFGDVALCVARRWLRAKPLCAPDRGHLHHRLLRLWDQSPPLVLLGLGTLAAGQAAVVVLRPSLLGLLLAGLLFAGTLVYVLSRIRPDWHRILLHRHAFRRIHLARNYAVGALRISESREEVRGVIQRVVEDLALCGAELPGLLVERAAAPAARVAERVDCDGATGSWSASAEEDDPTLLEEKRIVMCDVLREAWKRLRWFAPAPPARGGVAPLPARSLRGDAAIHCVVEDFAQIERVVALVPAMRREERAARAFVVFPGRHADLPSGNGFPAPVLCLGLPAEADQELLARWVEARYLAILDRERPAATVVVGDGAVASGCASAARECGVDVVQFDAPRKRPARRRAHASAGTNGGPAAPAPPHLRLVTDLGIRVIPAVPRARPATPPGRDAAGEEAPCSP